jgi:hypothetical protein
VTEWWQQGNDDRPVEVPRRDSVPSPGFSDPRLTGVNPELARFVPEFRRKRTAIAWIATAVALGLVAWIVIDLVRFANAADATIRPTGLWFYLAVLIRGAIAGIGVWYMWRWARQGDPRDRYGLRFDS